MTAHTPGPWTVETSQTDEGLIYIKAGPDPICVCYGPFVIEPAGVQFANARLIKASPDLLAAAQFARSVIAQFPVELSERMALDKLDAAITSATEGGLP